ncbi:hypothetical protein MYCTH_2141282 [Thermothelomyces thermophilus ATCC 42464]|uniref:Cep57 centrosome microtubule-binding domain-containing protein n=1 Tax=Thermothelomyces thermophilus (strain ATCC 42464 / BCRC 31852 / DSM 1799) TaxID=573729 RepID=G2PZS6_THET4|nr:uncharacterized protein MYCTH_2141282 [Thermothelomyces thermophilus ATCC 42464]AEO53151.1 hypothetical protein MYCTH_2141282 [Thermothelomyces thermophilus ATCC 42464]
MDINTNSRGSHASSKPKHISRLRKEMLQHRMHQNPFSSPPSSTGSHDTVSTTTEELSRNLSDFSFSPDGEGTRRLSQELPNPSKRHASRSGRFGARQTDTVLNTSVIARTFPEWTGLLSKADVSLTKTDDMAAALEPVSASPGGKENMPPNQERADENPFGNVADAKRKRVRADLQARVENESDCSTVLSLSPGRPASASRRSRFAPTQPGAVLSPDAAKRSLQDMASKIRTEKHTTRHDATPKRSLSDAQPDHATPAHAVGLDNSVITPTSRSFFLPPLRHLPDWTSGTLKFSTMKNGVPVFVRSGKSGVRLDKHGRDHDEIHEVGISKEDEEIFVSMDKLQEEVRELHDHDAMLQREAERLQREVDLLQAELKRLKGRKLSDSAIGSESDASFRRSGGPNEDLEREIAQLRDRLDQASRQVGVNDIHTAALTAERDEALHQASVARERATKLQAELEATQRDLESSLHLLQEKEELQLENENLLAENQTLKNQRDSALQNNKSLTAENDKLRRELSGVQKDLRMTREELVSVRKQYEALQEEKRQLAQDHASMERNNDNYYKENKKLQAQVAARDQHIADLKKGISSRDKMLENIEGLTTNTAVLELNAELQAEAERLQTKTEKLAAELQRKDSELSVREGRIRSLKEENLDLSIENERLREENQRLRSEQEETHGQWVNERLKAARHNQSRSNKAVDDDTDDCVRLDDDFKQREAALRKKLERREAAVQKVKRLSNRISEIAEQEFTGKSAKVTRIVEPRESQTAMDDMTGKSSAVNVDDDPTRELHLTDGDSDFASVMEGEIVKLKHTYRELQKRAQQQDLEVTDHLPPSLPPTLQRSKSDSGIPSKSAQQKAQPPGILKKSSQFEDTGRFSVKSALSVASLQTEEEAPNTVRNRRSSQGNTQDLPRPGSRLRRNSEADRDATEPNMTSAFFMPDITLDGPKQGTAKDLPQQPLPSLSRDARRVLDGICKHNSVNCNICVRIAAHGSGGNNSFEKTTSAPAGHRTTSTAAPASNKILITPEDVRRGKKIVSAEKPIPVSDRMHQPPLSGQEDPTVRPAMPPGEALAVLIKETQDEIDHLQMELKKLNEIYFGLDKSIGMRERRRVMSEIKRLQGELEAKSGHLYRLHDVLEGQKQAGQLMEGDGVDVTVLSGLLRAELEGDGEEIGGTETGRSGEVWEGFE